MNAFWERLSPRERVLAGATGALLALGVVFVLGGRALASIRDLDRRIDQLETELMNLVRQDAYSASARKAFQDMADQHSSAWTTQEIQDRLREEIYRLARKDPPAPGTSLTQGSTAAQDFLVQIPGLREVTLKAEGDGYREFLINIQIPNARPEDLIEFIKRLQHSRQSLRIDTLDLSRQPHSPFVSVSMDVTRTVVDTSPETDVEGPFDGNLLDNGGFERWLAGGAPRGWTIEDCEVQRDPNHATEGYWALAVTATGGQGRVYQPHRLLAGQLYKLVMDVTTEGRVELAVYDIETSAPFGEGHEIVGDGQTYRYELVFTPPGERGERREVQAPRITVVGGAPAYLDNFSLTRMRE